MTIQLTRLPDINSDRDLMKYGFRAYGRFALLRGKDGGGLWWGELHSSHPATTQTGWYWAITSDDDLFVSPRGASLDGEMLIWERRDILAWLVGELVRRRIIKNLRPFVLLSKKNNVHAYRWIAFIFWNR